MTLAWVLFALFSKSQGQADDLALYKAAYTWIASSESARYYMRTCDSTMSIVVSDSMVPLELTSFFDQLAIGIRVEGKKALLDSLQLLDKTSWFDVTWMPALRSITNGKDGPFTLFFSRLRGNILLAELFHDPSRRGSYRELARLSRSILFLLEFDELKRINKTLTTSPQYE